MIIVNDLCGDEDTGYLNVQFMLEYIKQEISSRLSEPYTAFEIPQYVTIKLGKPVRHISFTYGGLV